MTIELQEITRQCSVTGCEKKSRSLGMCNAHYQRQHQRGTTDPFRFPTMEERFWTKVAKSSGCWRWIGALGGDGYGDFWVNPQRGVVPAHHVVYELRVGTIPEGLEIDHLCRNPACVNPAHLEAVTHEENVRRGNGWAGRNARKTRCKRGHEFTPENTIVVKRSGRASSRQCRTCENASQRRRWVEKRAAS